MEAGISSEEVFLLSFPFFFFFFLAHGYTAHFLFWNGYQILGGALVFIFVFLSIITYFSTLIFCKLVNWGEVFRGVSGGGFFLSLGLFGLLGWDFGAVTISFLYYLISLYSSDSPHKERCSVL